MIEHLDRQAAAARDFRKPIGKDGRRQRVARLVVELPRHVAMFADDAAAARRRLRRVLHALFNDDAEPGQLERIVAGRLVAPGIELRERQPLGDRLNHLRCLEHAIRKKRDARDLLLPRRQAHRCGHAAGAIHREVALHAEPNRGHPPRSVPAIDNRRHEHLVELAAEFLRVDGSIDLPAGWRGPCRGERRCRLFERGDDHKIGIRRARVACKNIHRFGFPSAGHRATLCTLALANRGL